MPPTTFEIKLEFKDADVALLEQWGRRTHGHKTAAETIAYISQRGFADILVTLREGEKKIHSPAPSSARR